MELVDPSLEAYIESHTEAESELLAELSRETYAKILKPRMISGHIQGRLLSLISKLIRPKRILEIGTFTGYSALCMAEGLSDDGKLITIEVNEEIKNFTQRFFKKSPYASQIEMLIGQAATLIPTLEETFDLVFIDADKSSYSLYLDLIIDKVRPGGLIIADNVLWYGKVVDIPEGKKVDKDTQALLDFNKKAHLDERVHNLLLPIRDGLMVLQKK